MKAKNITILKLEQEGHRWRRDVSNLSGWFAVRVKIRGFSMWDVGDGLWIEPDDYTILSPCAKLARKRAKQKNAEIIPAEKVFGFTEK